MVYVLFIIHYSLFIIHYSLFIINFLSSLGLWIDNEFGTGRSEKSECYNNECLSTSDHFNIASVELWTFKV